MKRMHGLQVLNVLVFLFVACTNLTNPFLDKEGAMGKIVNSGLGSRDTAGIFTTYSFIVDLYLREHLDSFKVHIDKNRLWGSSDTVVPQSAFISNYRFSFPVSFSDTGRQKIMLISYQNDGTTVKDSHHVYVKSPLYQAGIRGGIGDSIRLSTKPVSDQVVYVWDFRNGVIIREFSPSVKIGVTASFTSPIGELYVEDLKKKRSPSVLFPIVSTGRVVDTTAPQIRSKRCNGEPVEKYYTSRTDTMLLELDIVDASKLKVTVNGSSVTKDSEKLFFRTKVFIRHSKDSTAIVINATDSVGYSTKDTLFVKHNRIPVWINTPSYSVIAPGEESIFDISVSDPDNDPLSVTMIVTDSAGNLKFSNTGSGQISWTPKTSDIGVYDATLKASDGFESIEKSFVIVVKGVFAVPVKFLTTEEDFPDTVYIGKSIDVTLEEIPLTGTKPFKYATFFLDSADKIIKVTPEGTDSVVRWTATAADTTVRKLKVTVKDSCGLMDSIVADIHVIREIVSFLRWVDNNSPEFNEGGTQDGSIGLVMKPPLSSSVSIPFTILFPATDDAADSSDISSPLNGNFVFNAGDTVSFLSPAINDDPMPEFSEKFEVTITEPDSIKFLTDLDKVFHGEIIDNDIVFFYFNETEAARVENDTVYTVVARLSRPLERPLELSCILDESTTATPGEDFTLSNDFGRVIFQPGETEVEIKIHIQQDLIQEQDETIVLKLASDDFFAISRDGQDFIFTIHDDSDVSSIYSFAIEDSSGSESISEVKVKVNLDKPLNAAVVLQLSVTDSNMTASEYSVCNGSDTLIFAPGVTEREITISVVDDTIPEDGGFIRIDLSSSSQLVRAGDITGFRYTVTPNEIPISFNGNYVGGNEWPATYRITIRAEGYLESDLTVNYRAAGTSTATEGIDYRINSTHHSVTIPSGNSRSAEMEVTTIDDWQNEGAETIDFVLTEVSNKKIAYIKSSQSTCTMRIDDNGNDTWPGN
ncbi:MAG: hypothetical protein GX556_17310 [Fibrobacter sp.]|nr:hypothetical protein [Fibrobacter sp.]